MHRRTSPFKKAAVQREASSANDPRLAESEQRYRAVIENASDMIQSVRADGSFEFVNRSWLRTLGYDEADLAELSVWQIVHPDSVAHCQPYFEQAMRGEQVPHVETVFVTKRGEPVHVEGSVDPRIVGDTVVATHGFFRDMTERIRAQELERENLRLERESAARDLEKMAALGKLAAGLTHELNNPASAAQRAIDGLKTALGHRDALTRQLLGGGASQAHWDAIDTLLRGSDPSYTGEFRIDPLTAGEREAEVESWLDAHDIGNAWQLAADLSRAGIAPQQLDQLATLLPATLLEPAVGWVCEDLTVRETSEVLVRSSHNISEQIRVVKRYAHMDRAAEHYADVHEGINDTLLMLKHQMGGRSVHFAPATGLPKVRAFGSTLNQVWTNLLDNAIDATPDDGRIAIRTSRDGSHVVVEIEDDGEGIPPDIVSRIFEPFFTTKPQGSGTGLGLGAVWRVVTEEHGGTIAVESRPGRTVFRVTVPVAGSR